MSRIARTIRRAAVQLARFRRDRNGVAATEFALILPVMLVMYVGAVEITDAVYVDRRVTLTTRVVGDLIARDTLNDPPLSEFASKASAGLNAMVPANASNMTIEMTFYAVDKGGVAGAPRAFVDWRVNCTVAAYTGSAVPSVTCAVGLIGLPRCEIDESVDQNVMTPGVPLLKVRVQHRHTPILAKLFQAGVDKTGWFGFIPAGGFLLDRTYFTWPRGNQRSEGPSSPAMATLGGASADQSLAPADPAVCQAPGIPVNDRFVP
jgi:Flp pilus assembly protein TadG